jgi:hypothetical protein
LKLEVDRGEGLYAGAILFLLALLVACAVCFTSWVGYERSMKADDTITHLAGEMASINADYRKLTSSLMEYLWRELHKYEEWAGTKRYHR